MLPSVTVTVYTKRNHPKKSKFLFTIRVNCVTGNSCNRWLMAYDGRTMKIRNDAIVKYFEEHTGGAVEFRELMRLFGVTKADRSRFKTVMESLIREGIVRKLKGNRFEKIIGKNVITGRLSIHRDGYGFVAPDAGGEDIFIPARHLRENMHGDRVEVTGIVNDRRGKREGRILRTLERGYTRIVGRFEIRGLSSYVIPDEIRISSALHITPGCSGKAEQGQMVVAEIVQ